MRILIATPYLPWPLKSGGNAAQFSTLKCLAEDHQFSLVCPIYEREQLAHVEEFKKILPNVKLRGVVCDEKSIAPQDDSWIVKALRPALQLGRRLLKPKKSSSPSPELPHYPFHPLPAPFIRALQEELERGADLFQAEFAEMLPLGAWFPQALPKVFIHHQIHFTYARRFVETRGLEAYAAFLNAVMQVQELAFLRHFDAVIAFSEADRQTLLSHLPTTDIWNSPFPIPADVGIVQRVTGDFGGRFLFVASEEHGPNRDALDWLLAEIWPQITKDLPSARLVVIGRWSDSAVTKRASSSVSFAGFVDHLPAALQRGIMLVPLRIGSGIRVKILAALAQGVPVVATPIGAEGLLARDGQELLVRENAADFAAAAIKLARQPDLRFSLATAGRDAVLKHYSPDGVRRQRNEIYSSLMARPPAASSSIRPSIAT